MTRFQLAIVTSLALLGASACTATPAPAAVITSAEDLATGSNLWEDRCRGCHGPGFPGIPVKADIAKMSPAAITRALTTGKMKDIAGNMTAEEKRQVTAFLTQPS